MREAGKALSPLHVHGARIARAPSIRSFTWQGALVGGDGVDLFDLKVEPSHLHPGFRRLLDQSLGAERAVI